VTATESPISANPSAAPTARSTIGIVAIGRNEGDRLRACFDSLGGLSSSIVYVDSGSTDGSVHLATSRGIEVVSLDMSIPFTAARARNEGFKRLRQIQPNVDFVQFLDGDCQLLHEYLDHAGALLDQRPELAIVCGWRRERDPQSSIYNELADVEWQAPPGDTTWVGGDFLIRATAFEQVHGFDESVIAGEEPELCVRLREKGWKLHRLAEKMTIHDAAMTRFGQWWKRTVRTGHAFAEGAAMHGRSPFRHCVREVRSNWIWGVIIPVVALAAAWPTRGWSLLLLGLYPVLGFKIFIGARRRMPVRLALAFAVFCVLAKFSQARGQLKYVLTRAAGRRSRLIEYKG
jgi:GT2 family glycosyltransferase